MRTGRAVVLSAPVLLFAAPLATQALPSATDIVQRVAANQERAKLERTRYIYPRLGQGRNGTDAWNSSTE